MRRERSLDKDFQARIDRATKVFFANGDVRPRSLTESELAAFRTSLAEIRATVVRDLTAAHDELSKLVPGDLAPQVGILQAYVLSLTDVTAALVSPAEVLSSLDRLDPSPGQAGGVLLSLEPFIKERCGFGLTNSPSGR